MEPTLSLNEWTVLCLLAERPAHGFALARQLEPASDLGRVITVRRPLVYRALDRVVAAQLAEPHLIEPGAAGPSRTQYRITPEGQRSATTWMSTPVAHVRELRIEFLVKMRLYERSGNDPSPLVHAQRSKLSATLAQLTEISRDSDVVEQWRHHNAIAVTHFLGALDHEPPPKLATGVTTAR